jgi:hypothetical protein
MDLQASIAFYCYVRKEFLYDMKSGQGEFAECMVYGLRSLAGRAIGFHVLTDRGASFASLPIHALAHKTSAPQRRLSELQLWDCFGEKVSAHAFRELSEIRCGYKVSDEVRWGEYMFTLDWYDNAYSDEPAQHKNCHVIKLDEGNFAAQPNNRMIFHDPAFTVKKHYFFMTGEEVNKAGGYPLTGTKVWSAEKDGGEWKTGDGDKFHYDVFNTDKKK